MVLHIIQVDKVGFHNSLNFSIPENVILLFKPAYSPEVNPETNSTYQIWVEQMQIIFASMMGVKPYYSNPI